MALELILIVFFIFIIINHILNNIVFPTIESMECNPNSKSKKSVCFQKKMEENKENVNMIENSTNDLITKMKNVINKQKNNNKTIQKNEEGIRKLNNANEGRAVDNSDACAKYPESC
jgi:hypothetical protein